MAYIEQFLRAGREYYEARAGWDIEKNRVGDFAVRVMRDGQPVQAAVKYELLKHDFDFGCNIFMLNQYEDAAQEALYRRQWLNVFNTAVVPLYWEGTEPVQGRLRYDAASGNDVYRRPPVDMVVEFCKEQGLSMKGHPLFWHEFIPRWLPGDWKELLPLIEKRFSEIAARYADVIPVFDAVNEPLRIWDMGYEHASDGYMMVAPPEGYIEDVFCLAEKYFPKNDLILNEAVSGALCEFKGVYGGYYQLLEKLMGKGVRISRVGLQCHTGDAPQFQNVFDARRLYGVLDGYAALGRPVVMSEISISTADEELQGMAAEQMYKICYSHEAMSGIFWWNLDDNGILTSKNRDALGENLPYGGLVRNGRPKAAYRAIEKLIKRDWHTQGEGKTQNGQLSLRGHYGSYRVEVECEGMRRTAQAHFTKADRECVMEL